MRFAHFVILISLARMEFLADDIQRKKWLSWLQAYGQNILAGLMWCAQEENHFFNWTNL